MKASRYELKTGTGLAVLRGPGPRRQSQPAPRSKPRVGCRRLIPAARKPPRGIGGSAHRVVDRRGAQNRATMAGHLFGRVVARAERSPATGIRRAGEPSWSHGPRSGPHPGFGLDDNAGRFRSSTGHEPIPVIVPARLPPAKDWSLRRRFLRCVCGLGPAGPHRPCAGCAAVAPRPPNPESAARLGKARGPALQCDRGPCRSSAPQGGKAPVKSCWALAKALG